jgi:DNA-directed RNA polymerase specialized sigma24 family protein
MGGAMLKAWTPKEDEALRSVVIAGRRPEEIAVKLRRSLGAIRARGFLFAHISFKRLSLKPRKV